MGNPDDDYFTTLDSIRGSVDLGRLGVFVTKILRNENRKYVKDYEVIDDIKDILGADNFELLREFVEIVLIHGVAYNTFITVQARRADSKARKKAAQELKRQQQSDAAKRKNIRQILNRSKSASVVELSDLLSDIPPLPDWVKNMTGVK